MPCKNFALEKQCKHFALTNSCFASTTSLFVLLDCVSCKKKRRERERAKERERARERENRKERASEKVVFASTISRLDHSLVCLLSNVDKLSRSRKIRVYGYSRLADHTKRLFVPHLWRN